MLLFVVLCLVQALVLNHVSLFGCATPLLYVYLVLLFPRNISRVSAMLWGFALGVVVDMFSNTPGMASASLTLVAAIQPSFFNLFLQHDTAENARPSVKLMGWPSFTLYVSVLTLLHCTMFFTLEAFTFFNWWLWLQSIIGSTLITITLVLTLESFKKR